MRHAARDLSPAPTSATSSSGESTHLKLQRGALEKSVSTVSNAPASRALVDAVQSLPSLPLWDVWQQYLPVLLHLVETDRKTGESMRFYRPAVFPRGTVSARGDAEAIAEAIRLGLSAAPMVSKHG
jgi:hypothetical protein